MFAYCNNNPVKFVDYGGDVLETCLEDADPTNDFMEDVMGGGTYNYGVDLSVAARSLSFGNGLLSCGYSSYGYTTPAYRTSGGSSKTYQTYTKTNPVTGKVYSGRTSGTGSPIDNVAKRDANHHMNAKGFGPAMLDKTSYNYQAIRGREQMLIDYYGGARSMGGTSGNAINGISLNNGKRGIYIEAAKREFGYFE